MQALEKLLGGGESAKSDGASCHTDANSTAGTPLLTNETNSPQSSSPPSTHVSADGMPGGDDGSGGKPSDQAVEGATPLVQESDEA